jgi:LemA protein
MGRNATHWCGRQAFGDSNTFPRVSLALIVAAVALAAIVVWVIVTYNRLVTLRLASESSWSQIDVALRLRHDLVPRLAEAVAGYAGHERTTLEEVTRARSAAEAANDAPPGPRGAAEAKLGSGIGGALVLAEDYPVLMASDNFMQLQRELAEVEEKISITRRVYNDTVETYNTKIQVFPPVIVARAFRFARREFFDAPVEAETAPQVSVGGGS